MIFNLRDGAIGCAFVGLGLALGAADLWPKAGNIKILDLVVSISDAPERHTFATQVAANEASALNAQAAKWTGAAAIVSSLASVLGVL
jgi:hypothetical protein